MVFSGNRYPLAGIASFPVSVEASRDSAVSLSCRIHDALCE